MLPYNIREEDRTDEMTSANVQPIPTDALSKPYTPGMISKIYWKEVSSRIEKQPVLVQGLYMGTGKRPYNGFYYDTIKDEMSGEQLVTRIHETIRCKLVNNTPYTFRGVVEPQMNTKENIGVTITFVPSDLVGEEPPKFDERTQHIVNLFREKSLKRIVNVDKALLQMLHEGKKPKICMIFSQDGIVDMDIQSSLKELANHYAIGEIRTNLSDKQAIIAALKKAESSFFDMVCIVRGGGSGLDIFDDLEIGETIVNIGLSTSNYIAVGAAIGHSSNTTLARQLADKYFVTPTALGTYLRDLVLEVKNTKIEKIVVEKLIREDIYGIKRKMFFYGAGAATLLLGILYLILY